MNNCAPNRRRPLGQVLGQSVPRLYDRVVEVLRTRHRSRKVVFTESGGIFRTSRSA